MVASSQIYPHIFWGCKGRKFFFNLQNIFFSPFRLKKIHRRADYQHVKRGHHLRPHPVDPDPVALHAAEPGHLALGELVDGVAQDDDHVVVA